MLSEEKKNKKTKIINMILSILYISLMLICSYYFPCVLITIGLIFFGVYIITKLTDKEE